MANGVNYIDLEYRAKNMEQVYKGSKNIREVTNEMVKLVQDCNKGLNEMGNASGASANRLKQTLLNTLNEARSTVMKFGTDAEKYIVQAIDKANELAKVEEKAAKAMSNKEAVQQMTKELESLRDKWQANEREMAKSRQSLLNGKKNTPIESSYLIREQKEIQKQIDITKSKLQSMYRSYDGATGDINKALKHDSDSQAFTEANIQQREARDILSQTQKEYDKLQLKVQQLTKEYGANNEATIKAKEALENIVQLREQEKQKLDVATEKLREMGRLQEDEGADVQNRVNLLDQKAENERQLVELETRAKENRKELISLVQKQYEIEAKINKLSVNEKGKVSEVSKNAHRNEIAALQQEKSEIEKQISEIQKKARFQGDVVKKIKEEVSASDDARRITEAQNKDLQNQGKLLSDTLKNFARFTLYYQSLILLRQGIQQAIDTMRELDAAFTDIRIVTNQSAEETAQLAKEYNALAKEMGSTTTEVAAGASEWLRQGKSAEDTTKLLKASMTLSKVGAIESSQATELLTSSLNGYKIEAEDAMSVVDKISSIDLEAATSSEELATALARTANVANDSEVSFNKLLGMIGTVSSVTRRSASTIRRSI